jgi:hypothetical protein
MGAGGTVWNVPCAVITGNLTFDYFWTLIVVLGVASWVIHEVVKIIVRS